MASRAGAGAAQPADQGSPAAIKAARHARRRGTRPRGTDADRQSGMSGLHSMRMRMERKRAANGVKPAGANSILRDLRQDATGQRVDVAVVERPDLEPGGLREAQE